MVELPLGQLARQVCELANRTVRKYIVDLLLISVQVLFFVLNAIQLYELCAIKPKGGFYKHVVFRLRWLDTVFQGQCLPSLSVNYVAINKDLKKLTPQLY